MKKIIILLLVSISLVSLLTGCEEFFDVLFGDIDITSPTNGFLTGSSSINVSVKATYSNIDIIYLDVNGETVYTTSESEFSRRVTLKPGPNTITAICYTDDHEYAGQESISVDYDAYPPVITITDPPGNWRTVIGPDFTIVGTVTDTYGIDSFVYMDDAGIYSSLDHTGGNWNLPLTGLTPDIYSYMFIATDYVNHSIVRAITFIVE